MTGWDVVNAIINQFPPLATTFLSTVAVIICIVGFCKNGIDFFRHGFSQSFINEILSKLATKEDIASLRNEVKSDINRLDTRLEKVETRIGEMETEMGSMKAEMGNMKTEMGSMKAEMGNMKTELATIKVNHFGHLKDFLSELTSILLDKHIIEFTERTRLENKLRGM